MSDKPADYVRFQRANFIVTDLDRALVFYRDVLGLKLEFVKDSPDDSYSYDVFEIDRSQKIRFAVLSTATQVRVLALTELPDATLDDVPMPRRSAIVLEVGNVDGVVAGATAAGCKVYSEDKLITHDGRVGREVGIVDFDGNLTVIYHIPAA
jgi:catechol 2,3-dioxygenase-like lactoylglutathione lyase family enzyme